jgi:hypothetical protein
MGNPSLIQVPEIGVRGMQAEVPCDNRASRFAQERSARLI